MKTSCRSRCQLNFYYKALFGALIFVFAVFPCNLSAIQLSGIYFSACEREIGVILNVDDSKIQILNLDGKIKNIRRFDIIYIAQYPTGRMNIPEIEPSENIKITEIKTLYEDQIVDLLQGWMINYSEANISFLTTDGRETVIDINDVWDIGFKNQKSAIFFRHNRSAQKHAFAHPYPFASCEEKEEEKKGYNKALRIYPRRLLEDPLLIKAELDRLQTGYEELKTYVKEKIFYPEPQVFGNITTLGIWAGYNHRHGSSAARNSDFLPAIRSELSEGLYKFQRVIVTGTAPMPYSVHEEPQTQFYYKMKAGYFHMSFMYDLNRLLIGEENYKWQIGDLKDYDDRQNEKFHIGGGFDLGDYAIEVALADINYGVRHNELFHSDSANLSRIGVFYSHRRIKLALYYGFNIEMDDKDEKKHVAPDNASPEEEEYFDYLNEQERLKPEAAALYRFYRVNIDFSSFKKFQPQYSIIYKTIDFEREPDPAGLGAFIYKGEALTNALRFKYDFAEEDLFLAGFISVETSKNKSGIDRFSHTSVQNHFKGGMNIGLLF